MKRVGDLWPSLTSFDNVLDAALAAARGKKNRPDVARFLLNLENEVASLRRELIEGSYRPGGYSTFSIREPKPRQISAASFRDRVVHHALTRVLEPVWEPRFSPFSFACRKGMGTHRAVEHAAEAAARCPWVLKADVRKYFASIDHAILKQLLARKVKCRPTLDLAARIIDGSNLQEEVLQYFPGDDLFTPLERRRGLPLGNQTSQFFANVYLDPLDQFVLRELRPAAYARYVDDFLLFGDGAKAELRQMLRRIHEFLFTLRLTLHDGKSRLYRTADGVTFLGWRIFPGHRRLVADNVNRFRRRMRRMCDAYARGRLTLDDVRPSVMGWLGHARGGDTLALQNQIFEQYSFTRSLAPTAPGRLLEQQSEERAGVESQQQSTGGTQPQ